MGEVAVEKRLNEIVKDLKFKEKESDAYKWMVQLFGKKVYHQEVKSLCLYLENIIDGEREDDRKLIPFTREYYRKRKLIYFWIQINFDDLNNYLKQHDLKIKLSDDSFIEVKPYSDLDKVDIEKVSKFKNQVTKCLDI